MRRGRYVAPIDDSGGPAVARERWVLAGVAVVGEGLRTDHWFSHETAALLHGLTVYRLAEQVHVTQRWKPPRRPDGDRLVRHAVDVPPRDRTTVDGRPVTTLERTVVDCARWLGGARALVIADSALRAGADRGRIDEVVAGAAGRPGVRQAREIVALADPAAESVGESVVRWFVHEAQLPAPRTAVAVDTWRGTSWLDLGWQALRVGIEFDGAVKYSGGDYGEPRERLLAEKRRQDALTEAGWTLVRVAWGDLADPDVLVGRIRRALADAGARRTGP